MRLHRLFLACVLGSVVLGCAGAPGTFDAGPPGDAGPREVLSVDECQARGGTVMGDPGDGSTHDPDYLCPSGAPPFADVRVGDEGGVCCAA